MHYFGLIFGVLLWIVFTLSIIGIAILLYSLTKQGDERKQMIVSKSCVNTFLVMTGYLVACAVAKLFLVLQEINPFTMLTVLTLFYFIQLFYYTKKYGG